MKKVKADALDSLGLTALLPLYIRALEARRNNPLIRDRKAMEMVEAIDFDFSSLKVPSTTAVPSLMRVRQFDRMSLSYLHRYPRAAVVNIGCGLDTRFFRVDNGQVQWYELDLPEVIDLRRNFFSENDRYRFLACSVMDFDWMEQVITHNDGCLFLAEGLLFYLLTDEVKKLVLQLYERYPGAELIFDAASRWMVRMSRWHPSLKSLGAAMDWSIRTSADLERWRAGISLMEEWFYYNEYDPRLGWQNIFRFIPLVRNLFRILHYRLGKPLQRNE